MMVVVVVVVLVAVRWWWWRQQYCKRTVVCAMNCPLACTTAAGCQQHRWGAKERSLCDKNRAAMGCC